MFFLLFLFDDRRIRIRMAQKHMDPTDPDSDPDPQHCKVGDTVPAERQREL